MSEIPTRLAFVRSSIKEAAEAAGRNSAEIELVAVTKTHPPETIQQAIDSGQLIFGENRVQEARVKIPLLPSKARWHLIGHLQKNKIRQALPLFELIHGVDSLDLASNINRITEETGALARILLEVNVSGESSKFGFKPNDLKRDIDQLLALKRLQIEGLMTIAPFLEKAEEARKYFADLRVLRDYLQKATGVSLPQLSMGMSGDYIPAIMEGATMVRVGTAIFGPRSGKNLLTCESFGGD
jgi:hypothetical protein